MKIFSTLLFLFPLSVFAGSEIQPADDFDLWVALALIAFVFLLHHLDDWISMRVDESRERHRKQRLENDKLALENKARDSEGK